MVNWLANNRRLLLRVLGTALAVGLIFVIMREEGWGEVLGALHQISWPQLVWAIGLVLLSRIFVASRWYVLLRSGDVPMPVSDAVALTFTGLFANNFLPTTIGGDVVRLAGAMRLGYDRAVCLASIAADRLIGMLGMVFTLPLGLVPTLEAIGQGATQSLALGTLFSRALGFARRTLRTFSTWIGKPFALLAALGCTWGHMLCTFLTIYILIEALAGLWSLSYFVTLVPISINGYGVQELSLTFLFSTVAGLTTATSLTLALLVRALYVGVSLIGAFYMPGILASVERRQPSEQPMD
jgi:uncharacterized membrane protein YbhN (UPF0104 family)